VSQIEINGVQTTINSGLSTWRELLTELESTRLTRGQVIASVEFDGDEVLQFREEDVLIRPLHGIGQIRIAAVGMKQLALSAVEDATRYLQSLELSIVDVAECFRNQLVDQANIKLRQVLEGMKLFVAILRGIELSLDTAPNSTSVVEAGIEQMKPTIESVIEAQTANDWALLADLLEYELTASLSSFEPTVAEFKSKLEGQ